MYFIGENCLIFHQNFIVAYYSNLYMVEDIIYHSETGEKMIAYRALYDDHKLWCRPYNMFFDEVNKNGQKYRFQVQKIKSVR